jgi:hypothetical protein
MAVFAEFSVAPPSKYTNVVRWYNHIDALLKLRYAPNLILIQNSQFISPSSSLVMFILLMIYIHIQWSYCSWSRCQGRVFNCP